MTRRIGLLTLLATAVLSAQAVAAPTHDLTIPVDGTPDQIAVAGDGAVWFAVTGNSASKELGKVEPGGTIAYFDTPGDVSPSDLVRSAGTLWLVHDGGVVAWDSASGTGVAHPIAGLSGARGGAIDGDGNLWVVSGTGLVEIDPAGVKVQDVTVAGSGGRGIARGPDGRMWWADFAAGAIRATGTGPAPDTQTFLVGGGPQEVAAAPGGKVAFGNPGTQTIGLMTPAGAVQTISSPGADPFGVATGGDDASWFAQFATHDLGRVAPDGTLTRLPMPAGSGPRHIASRGTELWVTLQVVPGIARVSGVAPAPPVITPPPISPPPPPPPPRDLTAPALSNLKITPARFRVAPGRTAIAAGRTRRRRTTPTGTKVTWRVSEAATIRLRVERLTPGRVAPGRTRCVKPTRRLRRAKSCVRATIAGTLRRGSAAGNGTLRWTGRLGAKALPPGRYRLVATAYDAANNPSRPRTAAFRIAR